MRAMIGNYRADGLASPSPSLADVSEIWRQAPEQTIRPRISTGHHIRLGEIASARGILMSASAPPANGVVDGILSIAAYRGRGISESGRADSGIE